jgi:hypothetical protein
MYIFYLRFPQIRRVLGGFSNRIETLFSDRTLKAEGKGYFPERNTLHYKGNVLTSRKENSRIREVNNPLQGYQLSLTVESQLERIKIPPIH